MFKACAARAGEHTVPLVGVVEEAAGAAVIVQAGQCLACCAVAHKHPDPTSSKEEKPARALLLAARGADRVSIGVRQARSSLPGSWHLRTEMGYEIELGYRPAVSLQLASSGAELCCRVPHCRNKLETSWPAV